MTQERIIVFDLGDLTEFEVVCARCGKGVAFPMDAYSFPGLDCFHCKESLSGHTFDRVREMIRDIREMVKAEKAPMRLRFRITDKKI